MRCALTPGGLVCLLPAGMAAFFRLAAYSVPNMVVANAAGGLVRACHAMLECLRGVALGWCLVVSQHGQRCTTRVAEKKQSWHTNTCLPPPSQTLLLLIIANGAPRSSLSSLGLAQPCC